jgi:hypothetical protein
VELSTRAQPHRSRWEPKCLTLPSSPWAGRTLDARAWCLIRPGSSSIGSVLSTPGAKRTAIYGWT